MRTKVNARYPDGEVVTMFIEGAAQVGDRVRHAGSDAVAVVIEVFGTVLSPQRPTHTGETHDR